MRKRVSRYHRPAALTYDEWVELTWGAPGATAFSSPFTAKEAWRHHRQELMEGHPAGRRPAGFWQYEASEQPRKGIATRPCPGPHHGTTPMHTGPCGPVEIAESSAACLDRLGLLADWECAELAAIASLDGEPSNKQTHEREDV